jgi:hypothetical protein
MEEVMSTPPGVTEETFARVGDTITEKEIEEALRTSGSTAPGPSGLTTKAWRHAGVTAKLAVIFNRTMATGEWDPALRRGSLYCLPKRDAPCTPVVRGDESANARPIALLETAAKAFSGDKGVVVLHHFFDFYLFSEGPHGARLPCFWSQSLVRGVLPRSL